MKSNLIRLSIIAALGISASAFAAENSAGGVIVFSGGISDTTCTINGGKTSDFTVPLTPISADDAGKTVGLIHKNKKTISMSFSGCSPAAGTSGTPLKIYFSSENISNDGLYLKNNTVDENDSSVARNVGFALVESGKTTPLPLDRPFVTNIIGDKVSPESEILNLDVFYYKTNAKEATAGGLASNVTYTISYL